MINNDIENLYNALKNVRNASVKKKITQVINSCRQHETLVGIAVGVIVMMMQSARDIKRAYYRGYHHARKKTEK